MDFGVHVIYPWIFVSRASSLDKCESELKNYDFDGCLM